MIFAFMLFIYWLGSAMTVYTIDPIFVMILVVCVGIELFIEFIGSRL